jgi:hypothetical protein
MKAFLRAVERILVHTYALAALFLALLFLALLFLALLFLADTVAYDRASISFMRDQAEALYIIAAELHGIKS